MLFSNCPSLVIVPILALTMSPSVVALTTSFGNALSIVKSIPSRQVHEHVMPNSKETHELARVPGTNFLLLSQMTDGQLVKIELDPNTEKPIAYASFLMGASKNSGLHGITPSKLYPGLMWLTLQWENKLLLVDPGQNLLSAPVIKLTVDIPEPGNGPHNIYEIDNRVWAGLKDASPQNGKYYVFSADVSDLNSHDLQPTLYECLESPLFILEEPNTKLIYVTQDVSSFLMRIDLTADKWSQTLQIPIPAEEGKTPVGMTSTSGETGGLWFSLAGDVDGGSGSFGRIGSDGQLHFFKLQQPIGRRAALLHLTDASTPDGPALWLLSTSLLSHQSPDALIRVAFDKDSTRIVSEEYIFLPSQDCWAHRIAVLDKTVMVSEMSNFMLAQLTYENTVVGEWIPTITELGSRASRPARA